MFKYIYTHWKKVRGNFNFVFYCLVFASLLVLIGNYVFNDGIFRILLLSLVHAHVTPDCRTLVTANRYSFIKWMTLGPHFSLP